MLHEQAPCRRDSGQVTMMLALMMGIFLMTFVGFATDYTNLWFQRQSIQSATDSTCQAAAVDLLLNAASFATSGNFTPGASNVNCSTATTAAPCMIAKYNGFNGATTGTTATMSFPTSVSGVTPAQGVTWPFVTVNISKQAPTYFSSLVTRQRSATVHASATCGLVYNLGSGSLLVLRPYPQITTFTLAAGSTLKLVGGAPVGVQVNADSVHATSFGSGSKADSSQGGTTDSGSDFAVAGQQSDPGTTTYSRGTTGQWLSPDLPSLNPYLGITPPGVPGTNGSTTLNVKTDGCPKSTGCTEYGPGNWPSGISVSSTVVAIFKPGLYYMGGDLTVPTGATVRNAILSTGWNSHYGVFFYFTSGKPNITATNNTLTTMASTNLTCNGASPPAAYNIPSTLNGDVLFAPCTTNGLWTSANSNQGDTSGTIRGLLFWMAPSNTSTTPSITGSSTTQSAYVGTEVLHNSSYGVTLTLTGAQANSIYTWGNIVTDIFSLAGAYQTDVLLNGNATSPSNKVALLQ